MLCVPLAIVYSSLWSRPDFAGPRRSLFALLVAACLVGLPLQLAVAAYDWPERDPARVRSFTNAAIRSDDVVFCDWTAFYPAKLKAAKVYLPMYLKRMETAEAAAVTVAIVSPHRTPGLDLSKEQQLAALGGDWIRTGETLVPAKPSFFGNNWAGGYLSLPNYSLEVYRRSAGEHN